MMAYSDPDLVHKKKVIYLEELGAARMQSDRSKYYASII